MIVKNDLMQVAYSTHESKLFNSYLEINRLAKKCQLKNIKKKMQLGDKNISCVHKEKDKI